MTNQLKKYRVTRDEDRASKDEVVYEFKGYGYGLASEDSRYTGKYHIFVTRDPDGGLPAFTIPKSSLEQV